MAVEITEVEEKQKGWDNVLSHKGMAIPIKVGRMPESEVYPEIYMRARGMPVSRKMLDKNTNQPISYKWGYQAENGELVEQHELTYHYKENGEEREAFQFDATLGKDRILNILKTIPRAEIQQYLFQEAYSITAREQQYNQMLYALALELKDSAGLIEIVHRKGFKRYYGLVVSDFTNGSFSMTILITTKKITPQQIPIPVITVKAQPQIKGSLFGV